MNCPIHIKEFWIVIVSAWLWSDKWRGHMVYVFSDNEAVVEVLDKERPRDPKMMELLREFMYIVCTRGFTPIFRKVGTKKNHVADFLSSNHDQSQISAYFHKYGHPMRTFVEVPDCLFSLRSNW